MSVDNASCFRPSAPPAGRPRAVAERDGPACADRGGPAFSIDVDVEAGRGGQVLVLRFTGEIDLVALPAVRDALAAARSATSCDVVVDMAGSMFCSVRGLCLLADAAEHAAAAGTGFAVSGLHPQFNRVTALLWSGVAVVRFATAAAAVAALRADRACRPVSPTLTG